MDLGNRGRVTLRIEPFLQYVGWSPKALSHLQFSPVFGLALEALSLSHNNLSLSGFNNYPVNEYNLHLLDLSDNMIVGEIPNWIWEIGNGSPKALGHPHR